MNTKIIERSGDARANIDETSKNKFCWSWMERSIEVYPKKISKKSSWNGGLVTIFYKTHIWKVCNFSHFSSSKRPHLSLNYINL